MKEEIIEKVLLFMFKEEILYFYSMVFFLPLRVSEFKCVRSTHCTNIIVRTPPSFVLVIILISVLIIVLLLDQVLSRGLLDGSSSFLIVLFL